MTIHPIQTITDMTAPEAYPAITATTEAGEWSALTERLNRTAADYGHAPSLHTIAQLEGTLHAIVRAPRAKLVRWTEDEPDNPWAWQALGMVYTYAGLDARGEEAADMLTPAEWDGLTELMNQALSALNRALNLGVQPGPALAAIGQGATVMGVGNLDHATLLRRLVEEDPNWLPGWSSALARSEPRWGGSIASMEDIVALARDTMAESELYQTLAAEYWWWRANGEAVIEGDPEEARNHIRSGLALCPPGRMRASLLALDAQILGSIGAPAIEIAGAWQAAVDAAPREPDHLFDLALAWVSAGDTQKAEAVLTQLAGMPGPDGLEAANWLGRRLANGDRGFRQDRAAAERWFRQAAANGSQGKLNLAEMLLEDDPESAEALKLCRVAMAEGNGYGALLLARTYLARGETAEARAVLGEVSNAHGACKYALARGLDEGWFGPPDPRAALEVSNAVLPELFHPHLSVLHMTLLSALGDWKGARDHGEWLREEVAAKRLNMPAPLIDEVERLLSELPKPGLGGLLKRMSGKNRLRLEQEAPDLWAV